MGSCLGQRGEEHVDLGGLAVLEESGGLFGHLLGLGLGLGLDGERLGLALEADGLGLGLGLQDDALAVGLG